MGYFRRVVPRLSWPSVLLGVPITEPHCKVIISLVVDWNCDENAKD